jgi:hypothetical protein
MGPPTKVTAKRAAEKFVIVDIRYRQILWNTKLMFTKLKFVSWSFSIFKH